MVVQTSKPSPFLAKKRAEEKKKTAKKVAKTAASLEGKPLKSPSKKAGKKSKSKPSEKEIESSSKNPSPSKQEKPSPIVGKSKQTRMNDDGEAEDGDEENPDDGAKNMTQSQAKVVAELAGIVLHNGRRVFALKLSSPAMIRDLTRIWNEQRAFNMGFNVPVEKKNGEVIKWKMVEFPTRLIDLSLKGKDSATCHGHIDHAGAVAMSELLLNWKGGVEFMLDGVQQSMF